MAPAKRILVINPNSTVSMTNTIARLARAAAPAGVEIDAVTNASAPAAIQGAADGDAAAPGVMSIIAGAGSHDAWVIACFDDTALDEARAAFGPNVIGIGEAACRQAARLGRFSVVTTTKAAEPVIEDNLRKYGLAEACADVRAANVGVLDLERDPETSTRKILSMMDELQSGDDLAAIVLGCAGMGALMPRLATGPAPVLIDPVAAGVSAAALSQSRFSRDSPRP